MAQERTEAGQMRLMRLTDDSFLPVPRPLGGSAGKP